MDDLVFSDRRMIGENYRQTRQRPHDSQTSGLLELTAALKRIMRWFQRRLNSSNFPTSKLNNLVASRFFQLARSFELFCIQCLTK